MGPIHLVSVILLGLSSEPCEDSHSEAESTHLQEGSLVPRKHNRLWCFAVCCIIQINGQIEIDISSDSYCVLGSSMLHGLLTGSCCFVVCSRRRGRGGDFFAQDFLTLGWAPCRFQDMCQRANMMFLCFVAGVSGMPFLLTATSKPTRTR